MLYEKKIKNNFISLDHISLFSQLVITSNSRMLRALVTNLPKGVVCSIFESNLSCPRTADMKDVNSKLVVTLDKPQVINYEEIIKQSQQCIDIVTVFKVKDDVALILELMKEYDEHLLLSYMDGIVIKKNHWDLVHIKTGKECGRTGVFDIDPFHRRIRDTEMKQTVSLACLVGFVILAFGCVMWYGISL
jgi:hypothetical protein